MARLASQANFNYVPLHNDAARMIASHFALSRENAEQARAFDPCVGDGGAFAQICDHIGIERQNRYGCEIHNARAEEALNHVAHVVRADALKHVRYSENAWTLGYINPPFDNDARSEGGGRLEYKFLDQFLSKNEALQRAKSGKMGGGVIIIAPQDIIARGDVLTLLAKVLDNIMIVRLPEPIRHFREVVVMGTMKARWAFMMEVTKQVTTLSELLAGDLQELAFQEEPLYQLPVPETRRRVTWKNSAKGTTEAAQVEIIQTGGIYGGNQYKAASAQMRRKRLNPRFPLHPGQRVFRIAGGEINGKRVRIAGRDHIIKGATIAVTDEWDESRYTDSSMIEEHSRVTRQEPVITAIDCENGTVRQWRGGAEIGKLLADRETSAAISEAVTEAAPPSYAMDMEPWIADLLAGVKPKNSLPGYDQGILPMQQHVIAAAVRAVTAFDPAWGSIPRAVTVAADMGCGKTMMGMLTAHALVLRLQGKHKPAQQISALIQAVQGFPAQPAVA